MPVTTRFLLEGAWYAAEQCGLLLEDASRLYAAGRVATAAGLALLGREELGKARILLRVARAAAIDGQQASLETIRRAIEDHATKQRHAPTGVIMTGAAGTPLAALGKRLVESLQAPEENGHAWSELFKIATKLQNKHSDERHGTREAALYVDPDPLGQGWSRPRSFPPERARHVILDANLAYEQFLGNLRAGVPGEELDAGLVAELECWTDRPELPDPSWPQVPPPTQQNRVDTADRGSFRSLTQEKVDTRNFLAVRS